MRKKRLDIPSLTHSVPFDKITGSQNEDKAPLGKSLFESNVQLVCVIYPFLHAMPESYAKKVMQKNSENVSSATEQKRA